MSAQPKPLPSFDPASILNDPGRPLHHIAADEDTMRRLAHWREAAHAAGAADVGEYLEWLEIRHAAALEIIEATGILGAEARRKNAPGLTWKLETAILDELKKYHPAVGRVAMVNIMLALNPRPRRGGRKETAAPALERVGETPEAPALGQTPEAADSEDDANDPEDEDRSYLLDKTKTSYLGRMVKPESMGRYRTRGGAVAVVVSKIQHGREEPFWAGYIESDPRRRAQHWHLNGAHFLFPADDLVQRMEGGLTREAAAWEAPQSAPQLPPTSRYLDVRKDTPGCFTRRRP